MRELEITDQREKINNSEKMMNMKIKIKIKIRGLVRNCNPRVPLRNTWKNFADAKGATM